MKKSYSSDAQRLFSTRWISALMLSMLFLSTGSASIAQRVTNGLVTLYNFQESNGSTVHDVSGQTPIDLSIQNPGNVSWLSGGGLRVNSSTIIKSNGAATRLNNSMSSSSEMTFECWVRPNTINQSGPARIMTCSSNNSNHNFSVGQNGNTFNSCLRTSSTSNSGQEFNQGSAVVNLLHYCFTWKNGVEKIYCNGQLIHTGTCSGSPNNWNSSYGFALCNEFSMDRPWLGDFYLVACYNQELDQNEVNQNFNCGPGNSHGNPTCIETCSFDGYNGTGGSVCNIPNFGSDFRCGEQGLYLDRFSDGTAHLRGNVQRISNSTKKFDVDVWFKQKSNYNTWSSNGGTCWGNQYGNTSVWDFYELDDCRVHHLNGTSGCAGSHVFLHHEENDHHGFQCGHGANGMNTHPNGACGSHSCHGSASGSCNFNMNYECLPPCSNVTNGGTICCNQSGCGPFDPAEIASASAATGGTGTLEYIWQKKNATTGWTYQTISGATSATYNPSSISETTTYRRCARRAGCGNYVGESNTVTMTISGNTFAISVTKINAGCAGVCNGSATVNLNSSYCDSDNDGWFNHEDEDEDNDGISNENDSDCDGNGHNDLDNDGDGHLDLLAFLLGGDDDDDNDGYPDSVDNDDDNDNIEDCVDSNSDYDNDGHCNSDDEDDDGDGIIDLFDFDCDNDGIDNEHDNHFVGYTFLWSNGATTRTIAGLCAGNYSVVVTNSNGCQQTANVTIGNNVSFTATVQTTNATCSNLCGGSASVVTLGGSCDVDGDGIFNHLDNDDDGDGILDINDNDDDGDGHPDCDDDGDGHRNRHWHHGYCDHDDDNDGYHNSNDNDDDNDGIEDCIDDDNDYDNDGLDNCDDNDDDNDGQNDSSDNDCDNDGIDNDHDHHITTYTYLWSTGATTQSISGLCAGNYSVTVTGQGGCSYTLNFTITAPTNCCQNVTNGGVIGYDQSSCGSYDVAPLVNISDPIGGSGTLEYIWMMKNSTTANTFVVIPGATSSTYDPGVVTETTYFRRCARRVGCTPWYGESNIVTITMTATCPCVNIEQTCQIGDAGNGHAIWMSPTLAAHFGLSSTDFIQDTPGTMTKYNDGSLKIEGTVKSVQDPSKKFNYVSYYRYKRTYPQWHAIPCPTAPSGLREVKLDAGTIVTITNEFLNWSYYEMDPTKPNTWTGVGGLSGMNLNVTHMPSDYRYGAQLGDKASLQSAGYGFSAWIYVNGTYNGSPISDHGDYNMSLTNCANGVAFDATATVVQPTCANACGGSITINAVGGMGTYSYLWNGGFTGSSKTNLCAGTYTITITSGFCTKNLTVVLNPPANCCAGPCGVDNTAPTATGLVSEITLECDQNFPAVTISDNCTEPVVNYDEYLVSQVCSMTYGPTINNSDIWLHGMPAPYSKWHTWNDARFIRFTDGTAKFVGRAVNNALPGSGFVFEIFFKSLVDWNTWQAQGGYNPGDAQKTLRLYAEVDFAKPYTIQGYGAFAGSSLTLNQNGNAYGNVHFMDLGPRAEYGGYGAGFWISYSGTIAGSPVNGASEGMQHIDSYNTLTGCDYQSGCEKLYVREWIATDACGNPSAFFQTIHQVDTHAPVASADPQDVTVECEESLPSIPVVTFTDNCDQTVTVDMSQTTVVNPDGSQTTTRVWTAHDDCNNTTVVNQIVTTLPCRASLGDFVWYDADRDGVQDATETGVAGITVQLYTCAGALVSTVATDANGYYLFSNLVANQSYYVQFSGLPAQYVFSNQDQGGNDNLDSDANSAGRTVCEFLSPGENNMSYDAGINLPTASLGDFVWYDINRDGIQQGTEFGVAGVTVTLYTCDGTQLSTTTTSALGYYEFAGLEPNQAYYVVFSNLPATWVYSTANAGGNEATDSDADNAGMTACVTLAPGQNYLDLDAGINQPLAALGDFVWSDTDRDGIQDADEPGVEGVTVSLYTCGGTYIATTNTAGNGYYEFLGLEPNADYYVVFSNTPLDYVFSPANNGSTTEALDSDANNLGRTACVHLNPGQFNHDVDAGINLPTASLGNFVWYDTDRDGVQDAGEAGVSGIEVDLYTCGGMFLASTTTNASGLYLFTELEPNVEYYVVFSGLPSGYAFSTANAASATEATDSDASATGQTNCVLLHASENYLDLDAGINLPTAALGDYVWFDENQNGVQDATEHGVGFVTVSLYTCDGTLLNTMTTLDNGYYHFDNLTPNASYYVTFSDIPSGYIFTLQNNGAENVDSDAGTDGHTACVFLGPGEVNDDLDAGVTTCPYPHVVGNEPQDLSISCDATLPAVPTVSFVDPIYGTLVPVYEQHFVAATCGGQYVRTWTVTNPCGHTAMVDQIITLFDNTLPVLHNVPANTSVECNTTIADANVTATDNCSTNLNVTMTSQTVAQGCGHVLTRTWSATDACGNTATASQSITIVDTTAPTVTSAPQNTTVECGVVVPVVTPVFADNCDTALDVNYSESIGTEACAPDITRTWVATDDCGNTKTVVQHITVVDTTAPTLVGTVAAELTIECNTAMPAFAPQFSDVCDSDVAVEITSHQANATSCGYDMVRTAVATDNCGNATTVTQTVHVRDTTAPVLVGVPANATAECGSIPAAANVTATDNCSVATVSMSETQTQGCPYVITRTWTATDVCGNTVSASQQITVVDTQAPVLHGLPADQTAECNAIPAVATGITASDVCDNNVTITYHESVSSGHCTYYIYRTWTATDDCGNVTEHTQSILVHDTTAPVLHNVPGAITIECDQPMPGASVTATDNCDNSPIVEVSTQTQVLDCGQLITRTWLATDNCGNASSATQLITVVDTHAPFVTSQLPAELNIECNTDVPAFNPTFADNCDTELAYSAISGIANVTACGYDIERSVTATDNCGNQTTATQVVHVRDTQAPVLHNVPASITAMCDEIPTVFEGVTATDNCDDQVTLSFEETIGDGAILPGTGLSCGATITRTWTATDDCGHMTSQSQVITVIDTIAPTLIGVPANATAECSDIPAPAVVAAYDNCYSGDITVHFNQQVIPGNGCTYQIVRVWTAQDNCGNQAIAQQILTVTDTQAPTLVGVPQNATVECNAIPTAALVTAQDNCAADMTVSMNETRTEGCPYTITRTWTVSDLCGNTTSAYQVLTVVDTQTPVLHDVPADATIECSEEISNAVVWATDNCSSDLVVALNATTVDQECGYLFIRTWSVTDACGNTTSQSQTITVVDTTAPVLQLPATTSVEVTCSTLAIDDVLAYQDGAMDQATQAAYLQSLRDLFEQNNLLPLVAIDNCDSIPTINEVQIIVEGPSQVECPLVGKITLVFQAMDNCGNLSATANTYIYIVDHTAPVLHGVPADADAQCGQVPAAAAVTASDDCADNIEVSMTESSTTGCPYVITRTWTATDACGNQSSLSQHITVHDNVAPVLVGVPTNVSQQCGEMPAVASVSAEDNCDDNVEVSFHEVVISNSCPIQVIRTWTATDNCNNTSSATQTIYISDTVAPILHGVPENATVNCHSIPEAPTSVFATDNCSTNLTVTYSEIRASGVCTYHIFRTWTVTDACGNTTSAEQMLTVIDNTPPVLIGVPANVTVSCGEVPAIASVTAQDDCSEELEVLFSEQTQASGCGYIITRTWSVADYCNHITTATQTITVADTTAPTLAGVPTSVTIECGQTVPTAVVSASDNCDAAVEVVFVSNTETSECGSVITNTWTATDACGNTTSATQVVTIVDTTDPIVLIQPQAEVWVECGQVMPTAEYAFDDNCDTDLNIQAISGISNETTCGYDIERSWIATDNCGNSTTISQVIHVQDTTAPVLVGVPANMFEVECSQIPNPSVVTATDNCSDATVTFTQTEEFFSGCHYLITRTWTATDACGNTSSATQTLLTQDSTAPAIVTAPADVTIECTEALPTAQPTFYDNCDSNLEITFQEEQVQLECGYQILRSWTAADDCYNIVTAVQVITVVDTHAPVFTFTPANMVVECNTEYEMAQAVAQDNCDSNFEMFYTVQQLPAECGYTIQRTWRAVDACGNEATVSQTIQVTDTTNPVLQNVPADVTIECGTAIPAMPTGVFATDNCDTNVEVTIVDVTSTLPCGTQIHRIFRATDDCGNSHIAVQLINVVDTTAPVISAAPADVTVSCNAIPSAAVLTATDACQGTAGVAMTETIVGVCPYTITRTWTATDACGNAATRVQVITVVDTEDPSFDEFVPEVWVPCDQLGGYLLTATDNCDSEVDVTVIAEQLFSGGCLGTIFRTYQATDNCGNFVLAQQIIHPIDQTLPQLFNVPAGATITCGDALPAVPTDVYATDNCDTDVTLNFTQTQTNQFCPYDVIRTWTAVDQCGNTVTQQQIIHVTVQVASTPHLTAYPNPSKDMMTVEISVPQTAYVRSGIYDVTGKLVFPLINGNADGGRFYKFTVDTYKVESGSYYLMMQIGNEVMHEKLMIAHD